MTAKFTNIDSLFDGNGDGNRGEVWRTSANVGGRQAPRRPYRANSGERSRTIANEGGRSQEALKTTEVQAFGGFESLSLRQRAFSTAPLAIEAQISKLVKKPTS